MILYWIYIIIFSLFISCNKNADKNSKLAMEENENKIDSIFSDHPVIELPLVKQIMKRPFNMRDSLFIKKGEGAVIQRKYKGQMLIPYSSKMSAFINSFTPESIQADLLMSENEYIDYELTILFQQNNEEGVYLIEASYPLNEKKQTYISTGKRYIKTGIVEDKDAIIYQFIPSDGTPTFYFLDNGNKLELLNEDLEILPEAKLNYTLTLME